MKIAIIGAGMAGLTCFYYLNQYVSNIILYDAGNDLGEGASGNPVGAVNPRFTAFKTPESDFYSRGFFDCVALFDEHAEKIGWHKCGALHLMIDEKKQKRFPQTVENWGWPDGDLRLITNQEASEISGIDLEHDAMYLPQSGFLSPTKLCAFYAQGADIEFGVQFSSLKDIEADVIILACGQGLLHFEDTKYLPLGHVRGQITKAKSTNYSSQLKCNLHYGGYCTPAVDGEHLIGATFQRWLDHSEIIEQDDTDNIEKLSGVSKAITNGLEISGHRASVRTTSKEHFPIIGALGQHKNVYISTAHGSHGIVSSLAGAKLITDMILKRQPSLSAQTIAALRPDRFSQ